MKGSIIMKINLTDNMNLQSRFQSVKIQNETNNFKQLLQQAKESNDTEKLKSACQQFESVFINILMKNMRDTVTEGGLIKKSYAREMFEGMLDQEISKEVAKGGGIGLAKLMYEQLSKTIETNNEEK
jgi:flagellar protein FlgJ